MINKSNLLATLISGLLSVAAGAAVQGHSAEDCEAILKAFEGQRASGELTVGGSEQSQVNTDLAVLAEEHQLTELFAADDSKNLVMQRPLLVMSAAQKLLALIYSQGSSRIFLPGSPHQKTNFFPIFSDGLPVAGGVRVVAQYDAISRFVDTVEAQAVGDRSGNSPTLLEGPHGTGKSEFLKIIRAAYVGLTSPLKSPFATYSFDFRNLHKIPGLRTFLTIQKNPKTGEEYTAPWKAPLNHSPVSLLPEALQLELFRRASGKVAELTHGLVPIEPMQPDPHSKVIADQILLYYRSQLGGRELTNAETVAILNQYVTIKRVVFGQSAGTLPTVEFQGNDIDQRGLFVAPDPMIALTSGHGSAHPLAWNLAGKVLLSSGNVLLMDEILRNSEEFLNFMLGIMESRVVDLGGSPRVPFDTVFIAATNEANTNNAKKDPKLDATLDRFGKVRVVWPVRPHEVAETMLYMKKVGLVAKPITGSSPAAGEEGDGQDQTLGAAEVSLRNIFPLPQHDQPVLGPRWPLSTMVSKG